MSKFHRPPVESTLAVGKRSPIGSNAMDKALEEMMPGAFVKVPVEHPIVEALVIREVHLRRVPQSHPR